MQYNFVSFKKRAKILQKLHIRKFSSIKMKHIEIIFYIRNSINTYIWTILFALSSSLNSKMHKKSQNICIYTKKALSLQQI